MNATLPHKVRTHKVRPRNAWTPEAQKRKPLAQKAGRFAIAAIAAGIVMWRADVYFGSTVISPANGGFAVRVLALLLAFGITIDFLAALPELRLPRREDVLFVAGADYDARKRRLLAGIASSAVRWPGLPCAAVIVVAVIEGLSFAAIAKAIALFLAETLVLSGAFLALVKLGWIPPSRKGYLGRSGSSGRNPGATFSLRATASGVRLLTRGLSHPYRWLAARQLLGTVRQDPVSIGLYGAVLIALGAQFWIWDRLAPLAAFVLTACMLTLTLFRTLTDRNRAYADACAYLFPPAWIRHRCDIALMLILSGIFLAYFLAAARHHLGSAAAWQCAATLIAFAFLQAVDGPGRIARPDARMILNFCYLGLAGVLFMFPFWGIAAALSVAAIGAVASIRHALPPKQPVSVGASLHPLPGNHILGP